MGFKKVVIVGPSGSGKTKLGNEIFRDKLGWITFVTHSTRDMREGEVQDKSYHFVSVEDFFNIDKIEYTEYPKNSNQYYGLSVKEVEELHNAFFHHLKNQHLNLVPCNLAWK